ncbi:MAG: RsmB/NOP family class I SAM-dependent RNA methyltransferase [Saprospiraceae bacterium]
MKSSSERLHPLLVRTVAQALQAIFRGNRHADKVIENALRQNPKAGSRDRAFIAETTYEIVRYYRLYTEILGMTPNAEAEFWLLCGVHFLVKENPLPLPNWIEFKSLNPPFILKKAAELRNIRKFRESIPDWLDELGEVELGDKWDETLSWLNRPASVVLRVNRLKTDRLTLRQALRSEGIETEPYGEDSDALVLQRRQNVFQTKAFQDGWFEVQDYSSQQVAPILAPWPGQRVVDACAGGGGKSLHLAALMQNRGTLIALDTLGWKLEELRTRARRAGVANIETRVIENNKVIKRLHDSADRLLLDVPCSGLGVLRRNPDSKWKMTPDTIAKLRITQQEILQTYSLMLKSGGRMVYATCSILPSENEQQVAAFLASEAGHDFSLVKDLKILPQDEGFDGFYMALLQKKRSDMPAEE